MSFKETDFPGLIVYLKKIVNEENDPMLFKEKVTQLVSMYAQLPVYPGIVNMCVSGVAKPINGNEVEVGQKIFVKSDEDYYCGIVSKKDDKGVILRDAKSVNDEDEIELAYREMNQVTVINNNIVKEMWPSLVFDKEHK